LEERLGIFPEKSRGPKYRCGVLIFILVVVSLFSDFTRLHGDVLEFWSEFGTEDECDLLLFVLVHSARSCGV